ncbi:MAG: choline-sulfatase [Planctomycetaceae bacterium]|nr:choline-sulfatase [Planctomycetaceae bacterium]
MISRKLLLCGLALSVALCGAFRAEGAEKPNILFIFADDQAFDTIQQTGNEEIETPNLDRLVRSGTTFTHAYNMGSWSGAVCVASRHMLVTGRFLWHAQAASKVAQKEVQAGRFWPEHMKQAGYETYFSGKWHIRAKAESTFDNVVHVRPGMPNQTPQGYNRPIEGQADVWKPWDKKFDGFWKDGKHWSEVLGDDAEGFLAQAAKRDKPFFMYLAFNAPHDPRQSPQSYVEKYPLSKISIPQSYVPEYPFKDAIGCGKNLRDEKLAPFPRTEYAVKVNRQEYYAIITHMDAQVGRILAALEKTGKADNTYIFFTADHGLAVGRHGLMGKQNLFDHSVRVPFIVNGPGIEKGRRIDGAVYLQDVMPTSLELAGVERPEHVQFKSVLPVLRGERQENYKSLYGAYLGVQRSVIVGDYKLILYPKINKTLLYNLKADPLELHDLAAEPEAKSIIVRLMKQFRKLQKQTGDTLDLAEAFPKL